MKIIKIITLATIVLSFSIFTIRNNNHLKNNHLNLLVDSIIIKGNVSFILDEESTFFNTQVKYFEKGNHNRYFSFLNKFNNTIYIYQYNNINIYKKIKLPKSTDKILGFVFNDLNQINIITYNNEIFFLNIINNKSYKEPIHFDVSSLKYYSPFIRTNHSIHIIGNKYVYPNVVLGLNNYPIMNIIKDKELKQLGYYPKNIINTTKILFENFYEFYYCYNGEQFVFSFPFSTDLFFTNDLFKVVAKKPCQSSLANIKISYLSNWNNKEKVRKLRNETPYYYSLIYDTYKNVYYRFVIHSLNKSEEIKNESFFNKSVSIIKIDKNNKILSEKILNNKDYSINIFFVTKEGLHICNRKKSLKNENKIYFDII